MLADFQQALADISASSAWCASLRLTPALVPLHYNLTPREQRRLLAVVQHPGMECQCSLYRMNRLSPLMHNLPGTVAWLGERLQPVLLSYWAAHPWPYSHGYAECERFCCWLSASWSVLMAGVSIPLILRQEEQALQEAIAAIQL